MRLWWFEKYEFALRKQVNSIYFLSDVYFLLDTLNETADDKDAFPFEGEGPRVVLNVAEYVQRERVEFWTDLLDLT